MLVEVHDTGIGITPQAAQDLFTPFTQLDKTANHDRRGTGLGLTISQRIVEAMGGRIEVQSRLGEGSCFRFTLELELLHGEPPATGLETVSGALEEAGQGRATVLIADDDPVNRMIAREMLESFGLNVVVAEDGVEALEQARGHAVDLIFLDCQMPRLDGYGTAREWRDLESRLRRGRTPIIALTANAFEEDIARARDAGMDAHLAKPYTRRQLQECLAQWL